MNTVKKTIVYISMKSGSRVSHCYNILHSTFEDMFRAHRSQFTIDNAGTHVTHLIRVFGSFSMPIESSSGYRIQGFRLCDGNLCKHVSSQARSDSRGPTPLFFSSERESEVQDPVKPDSEDTNTTVVESQKENSPAILPFMCQ